MSSSIYTAIKQITDEKGIPLEAVISTIEAALAAAYRKDFGNKNQNIKVEFDPKTGGSRIFDVKIVAEAPPEEEEQEEVKKEEKDKEENKEEERAEEEEIKFNPKLNITLEEAKKIKPDAEIGDELKIELEVPAEEYGRMAAQTAKQVIIQKLREVERQTVFDEFKDKEHQVINGIVQRREGKLVLVDLDRATAILLPEDQIFSENYKPGARFKFYVSSVVMGGKGAEIIVSRTHPDLVKNLFTLEIPEIANGVIEIKSIAREAGSRTKIAVESKDENIDPIGSCVGQRGTRVQTIISELGGEKIDIIEWDENPEKFIINALSPAKITKLDLDKENKTALATVKSDQLSLAIGKGGQNVRLAAKLTGWKIDIAGVKDDGEVEKIDVEKTGEKQEMSEEEKQKDKKDVSGGEKEKEKQEEEASSSKEKKDKEDKEEKTGGKKKETDK